MNPFAIPSAVVESLETDPSTASTPSIVKFLFDGEFVTANLAVIETDEDILRVQPNHDEIVTVVEGEADFGWVRETQQSWAGRTGRHPPQHCPRPDRGERNAIRRHLGGCSLL